MLLCMAWLFQIMMVHSAAGGERMIVWDRVAQGEGTVVLVHHIFFEGSPFGARGSECTLCDWMSVTLMGKVVWAHGMLRCAYSAPLVQRGEV